MDKVKLFKDFAEACDCRKPYVPDSNMCVYKCEKLNDRCGVVECPIYEKGKTEREMERKLESVRHCTGELERFLKTMEEYLFWNKPVDQNVEDIKNKMLNDSFEWTQSSLARALNNVTELKLLEGLRQEKRITA